MKPTKLLKLVVLILILTGCANTTPIGAPGDATIENTSGPSVTVQSYPEPDPTMVTGPPTAYPTADSGYPVDSPPTGTVPYPPPGSTEQGTCTPLPADTERKEFLSNDSIALVGTFYPASECNAPVVILFHQFGSSKESFANLALWLQNRAEELSATNSGLQSSPIKQYAWFPRMPDGMSFNVFALDFRGHGESAERMEGYDSAGYLIDAQSALSLVKSLPNISPGRIITIGTSIGADASLDACLIINGTQIDDFQLNQGCIGALSLSPGNYLGVSYIDVVTRLSELPFNVVVYCVAAELDGDSPALCGDNRPGKYVSTVYPGRGDHGIALLQENLTPDIGALILEFLLMSISSP